MNDQERLARFRSMMERVWKTPTPGDCIRFTYQELGEADSIAMKIGYQGKEYTRNNDIEEDRKRDSLELEIGQAYMMLLSYASTVGIDNMERALWRALFHQYYKANNHLGGNKRLTWDEGTDIYRFLHEKDYWNEGSVS